MRFLLTVATLIVFSSMSHAQTTEDGFLKGKILKDNLDEVRTMNHYDASEYCKSIDLRLPTTLELALHAQSMGAVGISDAHIYNRPDYPIENNDGTNDAVDFYFNPSGYKRSSTNWGRYYFWSSSAHTRVPNFAYVLNGASGNIIYYDRRSDFNAVVVCVK